MTLHALAGFAGTKIIPFLLAIIGFGLLIVIHELGHFLFCKAFGIHTPTFSIGFGPKLVERKFGTTNFRIAKIPFGGYVEIAGLAEPGQGEQAFAHVKDETSFDSKPYWQKFLVLMGGIIFNLLFAYATFCILFMVGDTKEPLISVVQVVKDSPAEKFGLKPGDKILSLNTVGYTQPSDNQPQPLNDVQESFLKEIQGNPNKEVNLKIKRTPETPEGTLGETQELELLITLDEKITDGTSIGVLGAFFAAPLQKLPFFQAIVMGIQHTNQWIVNIVLSLKSMLLQRSLQGAGGPVMIVAQTFKFAQNGLLPLFIFLALMSINLAIFNLLPLGITDGGNLMFATIEAIIRRPTPEIIRLGVNVVSIGLFLLLFAYLTYQDIVNLFGHLFTGAYDKILTFFK